MPSQFAMKVFTIVLAVVLVVLVLTTIGKKSNPEITGPISPLPPTLLPPANPPPTVPSGTEIGKKPGPEITGPISPLPPTPLPPVSPPPIVPSGTEPSPHTSPRASRPPPLDTPAHGEAPVTLIVYSRGNRLTDGISFGEMDEKFGMNSPGDITWQFDTPPAGLRGSATLKWFLDGKLRGYPMTLTNEMLNGRQIYPDMPESGVWEIKLGRPREKDLPLFTFTILREEKGARP